MTNLLNEEYNKLETLNISTTGKSNILNNIIEIKLNENQLINHKNHISVDIKKYLISIIDVAELGPIKYDEIRERKIKELINRLGSNEKIYYLNFLIRQLQKSSFENEIKTFQKLRIKTILTNSISDIFNFKSIIKIFIYFPLYNLLTLSITLFIIAIISSLIILPSPFSFMEMFNFKIEYTKLCENKIFNHFINVFSSLIGVNEDFKIKPQNAFSAISIMIGKIFIFSYVIIFIFNKFSDYLKR